MSSVGAQLKSFWFLQGMPPRSGVTEEQLRRFESRYGVRLPPDMRDYLAVVDGMDDSWCWDDDHFFFRPLGNIERASKRYLDHFLKDQSSYFVFADHFISLPDYAIQLTPQGRQESLVLAIYSDNRKYETGIVADSFSEFVERYLADDISRMDLGVGWPSRGSMVAPKASMPPLADSAHPLWDRDIDQ